MTDFPRRPRASQPAHRTRPTVFLLVLALAVIAAGAAFAIWARGGSKGAIGADGVYTEALAGTYQRINPLYASMNEVDEDLSQLIFLGLVRLGPDGSILPGLAELPQLSDDGKTYTFKLRKGATWHDGIPVTSHDVSFTIKQITDPDFKGDPSLAEGWLGVEVETPDDTTVVVKLKQTSGPFLARSATIGILPEHLLGSLTAAGLFDAPFNTQPIGAGPYKLEGIDMKGAKLTANGSYVLGRPQIPNIHFRFYTDYPAALRGLESGEAQGLLFRDALTDTEEAELQKVKGIKIEQPQRGAYVVLYLNNDQAQFFADERVRRAISLGIDRKQIVEKVFLGTATASSSPIAPGTWAYSQQYDEPDANIAEAKRLLAEAGWKPHPTTSILINGGAEFRFTIRTDNDPRRVAIATEIARQLEPLGIRATVVSTTFSVLRRDFLQERKYDAAVAGWAQGPDPDPYFGWHSSQTGTAGLNLANFGDAVADELIAKARTTNDVEVRKDAYRQFQEVWGELAPSVIIAYPRYVYAHPESLQGLNLGVLYTGAQRFADIQKWHD